MATNDSTPRTIEIPLTKGYVAIVDELDADLATYKWYAIEKKSDKRIVYAERLSAVKEGSRHYRMQRVILERMLGRPLTKAELVDHENHNTLDNTRRNLRLANHTTNNQNRRPKRNSFSGYKGVQKDIKYGRYRATIIVNKHPIALGYFDDPIHAACAYNAAAIKYFGEFAFLNDIPQWETILQEIPKRELVSTNTSGFVGVSKTRHGRWVSYVRVNHKHFHLGSFDTAEDANEARLRYIEEHPQ